MYRIKRLFFLKKLFVINCKIEKIYVLVFVFDVEVNIVIVVVKCFYGKV